MPIISACGQECCIIPSAVLSTHTGGFSGFTFADLTEEIPKIQKHWEQEDLQFDCIYTGYLGSVKQIGYVNDLIKSRLKPSGMKVIDPALADNGKLYAGFDMEYVDNMKELCRGADIVLPNITETCFLTGMPYKETYDESYVDELRAALHDLDIKKVILTGVSYKPEYTGVLVSEGKECTYYEHELIRIESRPNGWHGTGDIYASAFVGALLNGVSIENAAKIAADFVVASIKATLDDPSHWYGVKFETQIKKLVSEIQ